MGHQAKLCMDSVAPIDTSSEPYEFVSESIQLVGSHRETDGIRGTRSHISENVSESTETVGGILTLHPTPVNLDNLLPRILGAAESVDVFALAETVPDFLVAVDRVTKVFTYSGCKVNRATFRSSAGNPLMLELDIQGKTESVGAAGSFPALTIGTAQPYMHHQAAVSLAGVGSRVVDNIEITIDNALALDRFYNSQTRTALPEQDRIITFSCDNPYSSDESALYDIALAGIAGTVTYTNGGVSTLFTFGILQGPPRSPVVQGKREIPLRLELVARMSGSTRELVVTHDSAP